MGWWSKIYLSGESSKEDITIHNCIILYFKERNYTLTEEQQINQQVCGEMYCKEFTDYIYVNSIGELVVPVTGLDALRALGLAMLVRRRGRFS